MGSIATKDDLEERKFKESITFEKNVMLRFCN